MPAFSGPLGLSFRCCSGWDDVQSSFVDDPRQAVRQWHELVARVTKSLVETFSSERAKREGQVDPTDKASYWGFAADNLG
jgi:hypothetical protein